MKTLIASLISRFRTQESVLQPTPTVSAVDVDRIIHRDFPPEQFDQIKATLDECGIRDSENGRARIYLSILKLTDGNLENLRHYVHVANCDYRDVLAAAEYPSYFYTPGMVGMKQLSRKEQQRIVDQDWAQYEQWLHG